MKLVLRSRNLVAILALVFVLLGMVYSVTTPVFESPDEVWHFAHVRYVAQHGSLPIQRAGQGEEAARQEASQPPLYYLLVAPLIRWIDTADAGAISTLNPHAAPGLPHSDGNKNMVVPTAAPFPWRGAVLAVHVLRIFSLLLGLITVLATYAIASMVFPPASHTTDGGARSVVPLIAASLVAFNPQFLFISASINNDNLMTALASIALALVVGIVVRPPASARRPVLLGIIVGLAALAKLTGVLLLGFVVMALVVGAWSRRKEAPRIHIWRVLARDLALVVLPAALVAGWWYLRNLQLYGDITGLSAMLDWVGQRRLTPAQVLGEMEGLELSFWGVFGWFNILMDEWVYTLLKLATRLAVIGLVLASLRHVAYRSGASLRPSLRALLAKQSPPLSSDGGSLPSAGIDDYRRGLPLALAALWSAIVFGGLVRWTATTPGTQGRLLFPAIAAIAVLLTAGLAALTPRRAQAALLPIVPAALLLLAALAPFRYIAPTYARPPAVASSANAYQHPVHLRYGDDEIELAGYNSVASQAVSPGETVTISLYLQALQPMSTDYSLFIHLWGQNMEWLGQRDSFPGRGSLPTSQMTPGAIIADRYLVSVPLTATAPARIQLEIGFYDHASGRRLWATDPSGARTDLPFVGRMKLTPGAPLAQPPLPYHAAFADQATLVSAQMETPPVIQAGAAITLTTTWQAVSAMSHDYTIFAQLVNDAGAVVAQKDGQPQGGEYPTGLWDIGEVVTDQRTLTLPSPLPAGRYRLVAGLYVLETQQRLPVATASGVIPENWVMIGEITAP
jgi:4-amino-4-deoxy-L-arabinose transferase-like glycosyltransferase